MSNPNPQNQFKKGQSGNPKGAPKRDWTWSNLLHGAAEEMGKTGEPMKTIIAQRLVLEAGRGNMQAVKQLMDRMDGSPQAFNDLTSGGEKLDLTSGLTPKQQKNIAAGIADAVKDNLK